LSEDHRLQAIDRGKEETTDHRLQTGGRKRPQTMRGRSQTKNLGHQTREELPRLLLEV